jgi:hypothetical protein
MQCFAIVIFYLQIFEPLDTGFSNLAFETCQNAWKVP